MVIRSLGHACFTASDGQHTVIFDPFLTGNPEAVVKPEEVQVDAVLLSHGHSDHLGDAIPVARRLGVPIVAPYELAMYCQRHGAEVVGLHIGGGTDLPFGRVKLTFATHGSAVVGDDLIEYTGPPCGFLVTMSGRTIYYAGDTGLFGDMRLIGETASIHVAILPIGDHFTMGIDDAVRAAGFLRPRAVVPTHYSAFEPIRKNPHEFAHRVESLGIRCEVLAPGEEAEF
jgi:L-ascorbate metabolism protein UlaG (beta-lactamase superfamily)